MTDEPLETGAAAEPEANKHKVDIGNNPALFALYVLGSIGIVLGVVIAAIAAGYAVTEYDPTDATRWGAIGGSFANGGVILFALALGAHAVNWQIGRSGLRR